MPGRCCRREALPASTYCAHCKCERMACDSQRVKAMPTSKRRNATDGRWCQLHANTAIPWEQKSPCNYMNAFGNRTSPIGWGKSLELAVRCSYMFERMVPEDLTAFREFCGAQPADIRQWSGKPGTAQWSWLALANRAKWPIAVRSLAKYLTEKPHLWRKATAADFAVGVCFMLRACSGQAMQAMHEVHATQGLIKLAKHAGLINEPLQEETETGPGLGNLIRLGKTTFKLADHGALPEAHASMCADSPLVF